MKLADVIIGETYITRVSGKLVPVVVLSRIEHTTLGHRNGLPGGRSRTRAKFRVKRADTGDVLPKSRTPAALRPIRRPIT